jgi:hypothetical protein
MSSRRRLTALTGAVALACAGTLAAIAPAQAYDTNPASGIFTFTTAPGVLPAWDTANITLVGISPGGVTTTAFETSATVTLPIQAKTFTANATAGGFRFLNTRTNQSVRCQVPTIDTRARVVDCVLADGSNEQVFAITEIRSRTKINSDETLSTLFSGIELRFLDSDVVDRLNRDLSTTVFSESVKVATGDLLVTRSR